MTETPKIDRRILRTRRLLREALMILIMERKYDTLTITDVVNEADIRRATFYLHYESVDALLLAALAYEFEGVVKNTSQIYAILQILQYIEQYAERFQRLCGGRAERLLQSFLQDYLRTLKIQTAGQDTATINDVDTLQHDLIITCQAAAEAVMICWWLQNKMPYSPEELITIFNDISWR